MRDSLYQCHSEPPHRLGQLLPVQRCESEAREWPRSSADGELARGHHHHAVFTSTFSPCVDVDSIGGSHPYSDSAGGRIERKSFAEAAPERGDEEVAPRLVFAPRAMDLPL